MRHTSDFLESSPFKYRIYLKTEIFFSVFQKKKNKRIHTWRIRIVFSCPLEIAKTMETRYHPLLSMRNAMI